MIDDPGSTQQPPPYDVAVLYFRSPHTIVDTVRSVLAQDLSARRVMIVDNASDDGLEDRLRAAALLDLVELITLPENRGYGAGMNEAVRRLGSGKDPILFVTHEVRLEIDCARRMSEAISDGYGLVGPALRLTSTEGVWSSGGTITRWGRAQHSLELDDTLHACDWLDGSVLMVDRPMLKRLGGFDERYFLYWEDVDLCLRANRLLPGTVACVRSARAAQDTSLAAPRFDARNQVVMWARLGDWRLAVAGVFIHLAKAVREAVRGEGERSKARLRGVAEAVPHLVERRVDRAWPRADGTP